jgi:PilZ domain
MVAEREIRAKEIVTDILSEIGDSELMQKYRLTFRGLQSVFRKLVDSNIIDAEFLQGRLVLQSNAEKQIIARSPRKEIYVPLPVQDLTNPDVQGMVINISERGLGVKGLKVEVDEVRKLSIKPDKFLQLRSFNLKAKCRWVKSSDDAQQIVAGFEIVSIGHEEQQELRNLIETLEYMYR